MPFQFRTPEAAPEIMLYGVLTLSTRTTFLDSVMNLEGSTEQVPYSHFPAFRPSLAAIASLQARWSEVCQRPNHSQQLHLKLYS
jgi:hypothetical protein